MSEFEAKAKKIEQEVLAKKRAKMEKEDELAQQLGLGDDQSLYKTVPVKKEDNWMTSSLLNKPKSGTVMSLQQTEQEADEPPSILRAAKQQEIMQRVISKYLNKQLPPAEPAQALE